MSASDQRSPADGDRLPDVGELYDLFITGEHGPIVEFLRWLTRRYGLAAELSVLDVGCGTGRLLVPLADLGWSVTGLEPRAEYLARSKRAVSGREATIELRHGGFLDIADESRFDAVIAVSDPFWYILSEAQRIEALGRVRTALKAGGIVLLEGPNFLWILKHYRRPQPKIVSLAGLEVHRSPAHVIDFHEATWTHRDRFTITRDTGTATVCDEHRFAILGLPGVTDALRATGFAEPRTFSSYLSRASERVTGPRMIIAAQRVG